MIDLKAVLGRSSMVNEIRRFFADQGFTEVQTPILSPFLIPESYLDFMETELILPEGERKRLFLTPSPELWLKRLLAAGMGDVFEVRSCFRNGDFGLMHRPEFLLLEWYRVGADIFRTMEDTQSLIKTVIGAKKIKFGDDEVDLTGEFEKLSMLEAFERYLGVGEEVFFNKEKLVRVGREKGVAVESKWRWEEVFNLIYVSEVEPKLGFGTPVFIYNFPVEFAPLAKPSKKDDRFKERFELFINGVEICDGYSELDDPRIQRLEFEKEIKKMREQGKEVPRVDWGFIEALEKGLPECSGVALGVDRLLMIKMNKKDIGKVGLLVKS
ncbi:MAG: EF-P lysine aminoacylase GenX [bacterium]|nr:EF-P lysine aminoacylase GenX [bacterium]